MMRRSAKRWRRAVVASGAAACIASLGGRAMADARFSWVNRAGVESCMSEADLRAKVVATLGRDPFAPPEGMVFTGMVERRGEDLVATIALRQAGDMSEISREIKA